MRFIPVRELAFLSVAVALTCPSHAFEIQPARPASGVVQLPMRIGGRTLAVRAGGRLMHRFQWPGVYFQSAFAGSSVYLESGGGRAIYHVLIDDGQPHPWENPSAGVYRIEGLSDGPHTIRLELATECQGGPAEFGGFAVAAGARANELPALPRQIEFIGDSHTVGYGDTSKERHCTPDQIWATTDTTQAFGPLVAKHYHADYEVNAISGRGIVRNYDGFKADPLPVAYPFVLFDKMQRVNDPEWHPQIIIVALGTNDFSTPLNAGEQWKTRNELHADFERTYIRFVRSLRAEQPQAFFILAANDSANGEIQAEVLKVMGRLRSGGERRVGFVPFNDLELTGCDWHPSLGAQRKMASILIRFIDAHPDTWPGRQHLLTPR